MRYTHYCLVSGVLFSLVACGHLLRVLYDLPLVIGDYTVPTAITWIGIVGPALLAIWAFRLSAATGSE